MDQSDKDLSYLRLFSREFIRGLAQKPISLLTTVVALSLLSLALFELGSGSLYVAQLNFVDATTLEAAQQLAGESPHALLNFASARNPGGGFLGRAKAQEEDLCRCGGLYRTLVRQPEYYRINRDRVNRVAVINKNGYAFLRTQFKPGG